MRSLPESITRTPRRHRTQVGRATRKTAMTSGSAQQDLKRMRDLLHPVLVEIEMALDSSTFPDWSVVKDNLLKAIELTKKLERDQLWSKLKK